MKTTLLVEIEIDDEFAESYNNSSLSYHTHLYNGDSELAEKTLEENPVESAIAQHIEDGIINNYPEIIKCTVNVVKDNKLSR